VKIDHYVHFLLFDVWSCFLRVIGNRLLVMGHQLLLIVNIYRSLFTVHCSVEPGPHQFHTLTSKPNTRYC
jgi:hypothetical protein